MNKMENEECSSKWCDQVGLMKPLKSNYNNYVKSKHTEDEWILNIKNTIDRSINAIQSFKMYGGETTAKARNEIINVSQEEICNKVILELREYVENVYQWKERLKDDIRLTDGILVSLTERKCRLQKAILAVEIVKEISKETLERRSWRLNGELVMDETERQLFQESTMVQDVLSLMVEALNNVEKHVVKQKEYKLQSECLWSDKLENYIIECNNISFRETSADVMKNNTASHLPVSQMTISKWQELVECPLELHKDARNQSQGLCCFVDSVVLTECARNLRTQSDMVQVSLNKRKTAIQHSYSQLECKLSEVINKLNTTENSILQMQNTVAMLDSSKKVAQTRLSNRYNKPILERPFDKLEQSLKDEIEEMEKSKEELLAHMNALRLSHNEMLSRRINLQEELNVKKHSLWIDGERCMSVRLKYPTVSALSGC